LKVDHNYHSRIDNNDSGKKRKQGDILSRSDTNGVVLKFHPVVEMTADQFFDFCQMNRDYRIERTASGEIIIMSPTGSETGNRNFDLIGQLGIWVKQDGTGIGFDSSTGFILPNGATKSADAAWVRLEKWNSLTR